MNVFNLLIHKINSDLGLIKYINHKRKQHLNSSTIYQKVIMLMIIIFIFNLFYDNIKNVEVLIQSIDHIIKLHPDSFTIYPHVITLNNCKYFILPLYSYD